MEYFWHRVKRGTSLHQIAKEYGLDGWQVLFEANKDLISNPNLIYWMPEYQYTTADCIRMKLGVLRIPVNNLFENNLMKKITVTFDMNYGSEFQESFFMKYLQAMLDGVKIFMEGSHRENKISYEIDTNDGYKITKK